MDLWKNPGVPLIKMKAAAQASFVRAPVPFSGQATDTSREKKEAAKPIARKRYVEETMKRMSTEKKFSMRRAKAPERIPANSGEGEGCGLRQNRTAWT